MAIDKKLIFRKINLIIRDLEKVRSISMLSWQEYKKKSEYEALAERYLERIIGRMIDINFHLIIESGHAPPEDYFSSFRMLGELRIISHDLAKRFARLAGLRNRLAHDVNYFLRYGEAKRAIQLYEKTLKELNAL